MPQTLWELDIQQMAHLPLCTMRQQLVLVAMQRLHQLMPLGQLLLVEVKHSRMKFKWIMTMIFRHPPLLKVEFHQQQLPSLQLD